MHICFGILNAENMGKRKKKPQDGKIELLVFLVIDLLILTTEHVIEKFKLEMSQLELPGGGKTGGVETSPCHCKNDEL